VKKEEFFQYVMDAFQPAESLVKMVPSDKLDWKPASDFMSIGQLIRHLCEGGIGDALRKTIRGEWPKPEEMEESMKHELPACGIEEAIAKLDEDRKALRETLDEVSEEDFANRIVSVPWGWEAKIEQVALRFLEHFFHHKMQLFTYLKLLGLPVNTTTLYFG
jgi:uncharacterized damage-inducible protein DinB